MHLLDTNVVSELRKSGSAKFEPRVREWAERQDSQALFLSSVTLMELEYGVCLLERRDPRQARTLRHWLEESVLPAFADRILVVDAVIARECARLRAQAPRQVGDAFIAATAHVHRMTVVTRNVRDFEAMGVRVLNPWAS